MRKYRIHIFVGALLLLALWVLSTRMSQRDANRAQSLVGSDAPGKFQGYLGGTPMWGTATFVQPPSP